MDDVVRTLVARVQDIWERLDNLTKGNAASSIAFIGATTKKTTYPTSPTATYAIIPQTLGGPGSEGGSPTFTPGTSIMYAASLSVSVPPQGSKVLVEKMGGRWVFTYRVPQC